MIELGATLDLAGRLRANATVFNAWVTLAQPAIVQELARAGFHSITFDFQHGLCSFDSLLSCIPTAVSHKMSVCARLPLADHALASRVLDAGAGAVIMPMINSAAEAKMLVDTVKFPPVGERSWGPHTALGLSGLDRAGFLHRANDFSLAFGMIETMEALEKIEAILTTPGLDGIFIGPNDLSISMTRGRLVDPAHPPVLAAIEKILLLSLKHKKFAGIFAGSAETARDYAKSGFKFIAMGSDLGYLRAGAMNALAQAKGDVSAAQTLNWF
jgi:4-hydroxy-2-oxoheptanedioate aldolase